MSATCHMDPITTTSPINARFDRGEGRNQGGITGGKAGGVLKSNDVYACHCVYCIALYHWMIPAH
jgi:hypothetical protein